MNKPAQINPQRIMDMVQGICGIAHVLDLNMAEEEPLPPIIMGNLTTGLLFLATELNGETESLGDFDIVRRGQTPQ